MHKPLNSVRCWRLLAETYPDGFKSFNYLIGLQIYKHLLERDTNRAEELLMKSFIFNRKIAEGSLDALNANLVSVRLINFTSSISSNEIGKKPDTI